jgi:alpha-tubulin suppressor-like RCC1 family protein
MSIISQNRVFLMSMLALNACTFEISTPESATPASATAEASPQGVDRRVERPRDTIPIPGDVNPAEPGSSSGTHAPFTASTGSAEAEAEAQETTEAQGHPSWTAHVQDPAVALVAGSAHACALSSHGEVSCWGNNDVGQLGYGHTEPIGDDEPAAAHGVVNVGDLVVALAAGDQHTCAILEKGSIRCWGYGGDLALGHGNGKYYTVGDDEMPGEMGDAIIYSNSPFEQLVAGDHHSCVRTQTGSVKCWGNSPEGALGYGYATQTGGWLGNVPIDAPASFLVAGADHTCAITEGGLVQCWGEATSLGYGGTHNLGDDEQLTAYEPLSLSAPVTQLAAGDRHTCALTTHGTVHCWGLGVDGVLGYGSSQSISDASAAGIVNLGGIAVQIAAGQSHTCALMLNGSVRCWGSGSAGALGYGDTEDIGDNETPAVAGVVALPETVTQIVAGSEFTCALLGSGAVQCWGSGLDGRLGYGHEESIGDDESPADVQSILPFGL